MRKFVDVALNMGFMIINLDMKKTGLNQMQPAIAFVLKEGN